MGQIEMDDVFLEHVNAPERTLEDHVLFSQHCDATSPAHMWKFSAFAGHAYCGLVFHEHGGCLGTSMHMDMEVGREVKILTCDEHNVNEHWLFDGEDLTPRMDQTLCISPLKFPLVAGDAAFISKCVDTDSSDYSTSWDISQKAAVTCKQIWM